MSATDDIRILRQLQQTPPLFSDLRSSAGSELSVQQQLRAVWDAELVRAAIALEDARARAVGRLPEAERLWLTKVSLEQSTAWRVAQHKAARFPSGDTVADLCSGIGVDSAALLARGPVESIDADPAMALRCEWNLQVWKEHGHVQGDYPWQARTADVRQLPPDSSRLLHIDPDRRVGRDRAAKRLEQYCPDLEWMQAVVGNSRGGALKLGPASNFMQKFPGCEIELISLAGECREATVWFGELAGPHSFRATILPAGESIGQDPLAAWCPVATDLQEYIFDPDPAVVRSGLLDAVGEMHNLLRLDKADEYLTGDRLPETAFVTAYRIHACLPNNLKELKKYLRENPGRDYEIKCRHVKVDAGALQKRLPRGDGPIRTLFHLRLNGRVRIVVAERTRKLSDT
ncbi:MAG: hypothetical protein RIK87_22140 [Fuerstiella sp.]